MMTQDAMTRLRERRKIIAEEIGGHRLAISALEDEDRELDIAERVFLRFVEPQEDHTLGSNAPASDVSGTGDEVGKPANIPTINEMIIESLKLAGENGSPGLEPSGMLSYVRGRYWPEAPTNSVGPIAWRMWKRGELIKEGSIYCLPKPSPQGEAGAVAAPASSSSL